MSASGGYGSTEICAGIVGYVDLRLGARAKRILEAHLQVAPDRFRGIRHITAWDAHTPLVNPAFAMPQGLMADRTFREGFACLAPLGLSFDAWLFHPQIAEFESLARAFPATTMVLNHVGGPIGIGPYAGRRQEVFKDWSQSMERLAECPNAYVKLGGLGMRLGGFGFDEKPEPPSSDELAAAWRPFVETCISAFGAERCMFESNFPVDKGSYSYPVLWNACKKLVRGASRQEKASLFAGTAARVYRLALRA
jgi:predicted TIM-barrel fold metal-dependent hydrolase